MKARKYLICLLALFLLVGCENKKTDEKPTETEMQTADAETNTVAEVTTLESADVPETEEVTYEEIDIDSLTVPTADDDIMLTTLRNCDMTYCVDHFQGCRFSFYLYSFKELKRDDIKVFFDTDIPYTTSVDEGKKELLSYETLLAYNGIEYTYEDYEVNAISRNTLYEIQKKVPCIYSYKVSFNINPGTDFSEYFNYNDDGALITEMTVKLKDAEYMYEIGEIRFDDKTKKHNVEDDDHPLTPYYTSDSYDVTIPYNPEGKFYVEETKFATADEDIEIVSIKDINVGNTYEVEKYELVVEEDGITKKYQWTEGNTVHIKKGTIVGLLETCKSDIVSSELGYNIHATVLIEYTSKNGKYKNLISFDQEAAMEVKEYPGFDLYAFYVDNVDVINKYLKNAYYNRKSEN